MSVYDALLLVSFGGPEKPDDVLPFLERVLRGRNVPRERMLEVAGHYYHFGGQSPINDQNRALLAALRDDFERHGLKLPVYWGNRNSEPFLASALRQMEADGVQRALALVTSAFGSYSGCRQYLEDICQARAQVGAGAPCIDKIRSFFNHPGFIDAVAQRVNEAFAAFPDATLVFTAHSIPLSMSAGSPYLAQIREACGLVAQAVWRPGWELAFQSRSGPPGQPWLEPDINDRLRQLAAEGVRSVVVVPIGFLSDHMEVVYDLDTEAQATAQQLELRLVRAGTAGTHPSFVAAVRELVLERLDPACERRFMGSLGPAPDVCAEGCCPAPARRP
jgi:ferrochelatase